MSSRVPRIAFVLAFGMLVGIAGVTLSAPIRQPAPAAVAGTLRPASEATPPDATPSAPASPGAPASPKAPPSPAASPGASLEPPAPPESVRVPLVPITGFWSTARSISRAELTVALASSAARPRQVFVAAADLAPLAAMLRVKPGRTVHALPPKLVRARIAANPGALGIVRADDVTPTVRALAVGGISLYGERRVGDLAAYPLLISEPAGAVPSAFDPSAVWALAAGGDVMLDREVYRLAVTQRKGADYPWNGGTAAITTRACCGAPGLGIVRGRRTGHPGAVRTLLKGADLAIVNLEGPAPNAFTYHPHGYVFSMDPRLLVGLRRAGIDAVSVANNHIRNAGSVGVNDTIRNLDRLGIRHAGAGRSLAAARKPAWLGAGGLRIAVLAYNGAGGAPATAAAAGAAPLRGALMRADIRAARRSGADIVIVVPHWGREYTDRVAASDRQLARSLVAAGADIVLGSHSHWAGPLEFVNGRLVVYSLGDLVFDLQHDARTQQAMIVEATFVGRHLAQVNLHPTLILDASQPNLLDAKRGGNLLLRSIEEGSRSLK